jgi:maltooligosyltrehalose trehalohydrolase
MTAAIPHHGAVVSGDGVHFSVWAPGKNHGRVRIIRAGSGIEEEMILSAAADGFHELRDADGRAGDRYQYLLDDKGPYPDPASRHQPDGVHGSSMVIDPRQYRWQDGKWKRPRFRDLVIYELHVGTFTPEGTFRSAMEKLPHVADLGFNAVQMMPIADFPGERNWGYDGVCLYAPARCYGQPDDLRALVDAAHQQGIAVVLDVVYNHLGPDGNFLGAYNPHYFNHAHQTPWGDALNYDGPQAAPVRSFFLANAAYWLDEFHMDGLRLDATHAIMDDSSRHVLGEIAALVHQRGGYVIAEDERNHASVVSPPPQGHGLDAVYADDFCHTVQVALGDDSYAVKFDGTAEELVDELQHGWRYRGQIPVTGCAPRGTSCAHLPPEKFLYCISNHDQVGNRAFGERLEHLASPAASRAALALLLLSPFTPLVFMGQEWAASTPFRFFTDHTPELGRLVNEGRRKEFAHFPQFSDPEAVALIPDPQSAETFECSKLNWPELTEHTHAGVLALGRECLRLRADHAAFRPGTREGWSAGLVDDAVVIRYEDGVHSWLVLTTLNRACRVHLDGSNLCKLDDGRHWRPVLFSNALQFGGSGQDPFNTSTNLVEFTVPELLLLKSDA